MGLRKLTTAAAMGAMIASLPITAAAAAPVRASQSLPTVAAGTSTAVGRTDAALEDSSDLQGRRRGFFGGGFIVVVAVVLVIIGIYFAVDDDDDDVAVSRA